MKIKHIKHTVISCEEDGCKGKFVIDKPSFGGDFGVIELKKYYCPHGYMLFSETVFEDEKNDQDQRPV